MICSGACLCFFSLLRPPEIYMTFNSTVIYFECQQVSHHGELDSAGQAQGGHLMFKSRKMCPSPTHLHSCYVFLWTSPVTYNTSCICCSFLLKNRPKATKALSATILLFSVKNKNMSFDSAGVVLSSQNPAVAGRWGVVTCPLFTISEVNLFFKSLLIYNPCCS